MTILKRIFIVFAVFLSFNACQKDDKVEPKSTLKEMLSFSFKQSANPTLGMDIEGMIVGKEVKITLPPLTKTSALKATFSSSPLSSISVNGTKQESGITVNDFTKPVIYKVTAEDGSTTEYTVTIAVAKSNDKTISSFAFTKADNPSLTADIMGTINGKDISITLPSGIKATTFIASFMVSPMATVTINNVSQVSSVTANDFTKPVVYRVNAEDGSTNDYTVTVISNLSTQKELLSFAFLKANNASMTDDVAVPLVSNGTYYLVTLPTGSSITGLKPTFSVSNGATIAMNGVAQVSGATANDFSKIITYRITAQDGSTKDVTIEVSVQLDIASIENAAKNFMTKYNLPGMSIAITNGERLVYAKGYGYADVEKSIPVTNKTIFRMGSMSKSVTAIALMKLVDEGKINLDQKVFGTNGILGTTYGTKPYTPQLLQITVRQILNHTAGGDAWNHLWNYPTRIDPFYQPEWINYSQAEVISATLDTRPVTETPGTKFAYSNVGYNILGRIIEKVSGLDYEKYVQEHVLAPIGISAASMRIGKGKQEQRVADEATYYNPYSGYDQPYAFPLERMDAQGAWISTTINMARLMCGVDGFSNQKDILSSKSILEMYTPSQTSLNQLGGWGYGLGWYVLNGLYTHDGGLAGSSATWWRYSSGYNYVVLVNTRSADNSYYADLETFIANAIGTGTANFMKGDQFNIFYK